MSCVIMLFNKDIYIDMMFPGRVIYCKINGVSILNYIVCLEGKVEVGSKNKFGMFALES